MDTEQLTSYVATERARGVADADIRTQLLTTGWKEEDANTALGIISSSLATSTAPREFSLRKIDQGRIARMDYFVSGFIVWIFAFFALLPASLLGNTLGGTAMIIITILVYLVALVFTIGLATRRLHDMNMCGWYVLICLIPGLGLFFSLFILFMPGSAGINRYGNPPSQKRGLIKQILNT